MALDIDPEILELQKHPELGRYLRSAFEKIVSAVNLSGKNTGTNPTSAKMPAPPPIQGINIKTDGAGTVHATISDSNQIARGLHYFVEYDTDPSFRQPHVVHLGVSRSMNPITLPAMDDNGKDHKFYFRAYSAYPGGEPGPVMPFGGSTPTPVSPGGSTKMTLLPSTGSGTAQNSGQEGGSGFGRVLLRPASGVKRSSAQTQNT